MSSLIGQQAERGGDTNKVLGGKKKKDFLSLGLKILHANSEVLNAALFHTMDSVLFV